MIISSILKEELIKIIPNLNDLIRDDDLSEVETLLDIAIVNALDNEYNSTPKSRRLQKLYDELYRLNK